MRMASTFYEFIHDCIIEDVLRVMVIYILVERSYQIGISAIIGFGFSDDMSHWFRVVHEVHRALEKAVCRWQITMPCFHQLDKLVKEYPA